MIFRFTYILLWFMIVFFNQETAAQNIIEIDIQQISISDTIIVKEIAQIVSKQENRNVDSVSDPWFQNGFGYVNLRVDIYPKGDTILRYCITLDQSPIDPAARDSLFPNYYTVINGRPILIYYPEAIMSTLGLKFSRKSKAKFLKQLDKVLPKPRKEVGRNKKGEVVLQIDNFRPHYVTFGMSKTIYVLRDNIYMVDGEQDF